MCTALQSASGQPALCVRVLPTDLPVPLADVIQGQREQVVLCADEEAAALLVQQQGLVAA